MLSSQDTLQAGSLLPGSSHTLFHASPKELHIPQPAPSPTSSSGSAVCAHQCQLVAALLLDPRFWDRIREPENIPGWEEPTGTMGSNRWLCTPKAKSTEGEGTPSTYRSEDSKSGLKQGQLLCAHSIQPCKKQLFPLFFSNFIYQTSAPAKINKGRNHFCQDLLKL